VKTGAVALAAFTIVPRHVLGRGYRAPSDTLYIASVGIGGKGNDDITRFAASGKAKMAFLCDVDQEYAAKAYTKFPEAKRYVDWREMFDKESKNFDAVSVATPDHTHAVVGTAAITLGKHIWIQKPLAHDIYEARVLADLVKKHKVVSQMGNQGTSNDGLRQLREWYDAGVIGDVTEVYTWTNRPAGYWPQGGMKWPEKTGTPPTTFNWDLWQGTAQAKPFPAGPQDGGYIIAPFNWRGWWDYGTGVIGDMGAHILEAPMTVLGLEHVSQVQSTVAVPGLGFKNEDFPDNGPASSYTVMTFPKSPKTSGVVKVHWMDGGLMPPRPEELDPAELWTSEGGSGGGMLFIGTKGKMRADVYSANARLLPYSRMDEVNVPQKFARVPNQANGHYAQWVEACLAGYGNMETSSPFEKAALLTENMLVANLAIRGYNLGVTVPAPATATPGRPTRGPRTRYPARGINLIWDAKNMKVTNVDEVNRYVKREYRAPWKLSGI
jgi:predicted dehydrogenase